MFDTKYVAFDDEFVIIFPPTLVHKEVAQYFSDRKVTGAGFVNMETHKAFGESTSLGVKSGPLDSFLIGQVLGRK